VKTCLRLFESLRSALCCLRIHVGSEKRQRQQHARHVVMLSTADVTPATQRPRSQHVVRRGTSGHMSPGEEASEHVVGAVSVARCEQQVVSAR